VATSLFDWSKNTPNLFSKGVANQNFTVIDGMNFVKPEFAKIKDPYIVIEAMTYMEGGVEHVVEHWEEEVDESRGESGTLAFGLYGDPTNEDKLYTVAAYESEDYLKNVHAKSATAKEVEHHTEGMRIGQQTLVLQKKGGFLYKAASGCT
jgi:quinol monooxygenase YgiN